MQASVGMVSCETCPQFGQVNSEVVIIEASGPEAVSPWAEATATTAPALAAQRDNCRDAGRWGSPEGRPAEWRRARGASLLLKRAPAPTLPRRAPPPAAQPPRRSSATDAGSRYRRIHRHKRQGDDKPTKTRPPATLRHRTMRTASGTKDARAPRRR